MTNTRDIANKKKLKERFEKLLNINPGKQDGTCVLCTKETIKILLAGKSYEPADRSPSAIDKLEVESDSQEFINAIKEANEIRKERNENLIDEPDELKVLEFEKTREFMKYLDSVEPGTLLGVDTESHCFNVLKDFDGRIILIDSAAQLFKYINTKEDFKLSKQEFNLIDPYENDITTENSENEEHEELMDIFTMRDESDMTFVYELGKIDDSWKPHISLGLFDKTSPQDENNTQQQTAKPIDVPPKP
jgi:hypothetical protein